MRDTLCHLAAQTKVTWQRRPASARALPLRRERVSLATPAELTRRQGVRWGALARDLKAATEATAMLPGRRAGRAVLDVLSHLLMDARRGLVTFATPCPGPPDTDYVTCRRPYAPASGQPAAVGGSGAARHARHVRIAASACSPAELASEWRQTSAAAIRAARACPCPVLAAQDHAPDTAGFTATLATEAAIHYLDMTAALPEAPDPDPGSLTLARQVLTQLAGHPLPANWDDATCVLKGTGRIPLTPAGQSALGPAAGKLPLFG